MDRKEAVAKGFVIDEGQRPVAYKGPRFNPTEWHRVETEDEEALRAENERLEAEIESLRAQLTEANCKLTVAREALRYGKIYAPYGSRAKDAIEKALAEIDAARKEG